MTVDGKVEKNKGRHMGRRMLSRYINVQLASVSLSNACSCSRRNGHTRHLQMEMVPMVPCRRGTVLYHSHPPPFLPPSHPASHIIVQPLPATIPNRSETSPTPSQLLFDPARRVHVARSSYTDHFSLIQPPCKHKLPIATHQPTHPFIHRDPTSS